MAYQRRTRTEMVVGVVDVSTPVTSHAQDERVTGGPARIQNGFRRGILMPDTGGSQHSGSIVQKWVTDS
eukprot:m.980647 g.980647  ORF g.980647 m.980647 type:complete len:69 (+) comp23969_c0_seq13:1401-1607(+)